MFGRTSRRWARARISHARQVPLLVPLNTHNKCTGVCRFVRGIPVGTAHRAADLWGFCGSAEAPDSVPANRSGSATSGD
jgi:hypothetical protein